MVLSVVARMMDPKAGVIGMLQLILLVMSQCALVPEIAAPESINHSDNCRVDVAMCTLRGMNMLSRDELELELELELKLDPRSGMSSGSSIESISRSDSSQSQHEVLNFFSIS